MKDNNKILIIDDEVKIVEVVKSYLLRTKLSVSFIAVGMLCIALISIFSNIYIEKHFKEYIKRN